MSFGVNKAKILYFLLFVLFATYVVFPLFCVAMTPTAGDFDDVFGSEIWIETVRNTFWECIFSTFLSVLIGYVFAYAVVKGNILFRRFFNFIPVIHLVTPPFVGGLSFILLYGRQGFVTHTLLGLDVSLYGFWGLLIAQVLCFFPIAYLICVQTLTSINTSLEKAARGMGASGIRVFFTITLPLSLPGILSSLLFIAVSVLSDFGNPMIVAGRYRVLAVEVYTQLTGWINPGRSAVLGIFLVAPSIILFALQIWMMKKNAARIAQIGTKVSSFGEEKTDPVVRILLTVFCGIFSFLILAQFASIIAGSFQKLWSVDTKFTFEHIACVFEFSTELKNSLFYALWGALCAVTVSTLAAYYVQRTNFRFRKVLDVLVQLPAAIPGSLFGLAFVLANAMVKMHSSGEMIIIAMMVGFMPFSYRLMYSKFSQIKTNLDESAFSLGAERLYVLKSVLIPVSGNGIFSAFVYDFVRGVGTMSAVIFLVSFDTPLSSISILNLAEQGSWGKAAALALVLTIFTFAVLGISRMITFFWSRHNESTGA